MGGRRSSLAVELLGCPIVSESTRLSCRHVVQVPVDVDFESKDWVG